MTKSRDLADLPAGSGDIDVNGTVTADGLAVDGDGLLYSASNIEMRGDANVRISLGTAGTSGINNLSNWVYGNGTNLRFNNAGGFYSWEGTGIERMRLSSSGNLLVGTTNSSPANNNVVGGGFFTTAAGTRIEASVNGGSILNRTTSNGTILQFNRAGVAVGSITVTTSTTAYNTSSDYRLKENVVDMTDAVDRVKALPVRRFNFIGDNTTVDGFLAHEAQEIVPESVTGEKDAVESIGNVTDAEGVVVQEGVTEPTELPEDQTWTKTGDRPVMQGIDQAKLVPLLTGALKEAIAKIETLETTQADLIARIEALEAN